MFFLIFPQLCKQLKAQSEGATVSRPVARRPRRYESFACIFLRGDGPTATPPPVLGRPARPRAPHQWCQSSGRGRAKLPLYDIRPQSSEKPGLGSQLNSHIEPPSVVEIQGKKFNLAPSAVLLE